VGNALFGGTAEYVALSFKAANMESWFAWYVVAIVSLALVASVLMPDTKRYSYLDGTAQGKI
jgi:MHS family alpha-ketoglutarate permease-like MFS transporter